MYGYLYALDVASETETIDHYVQGPPGYFESHENGECSFYAKTMYDIQKNGRQFANHLDPMLPQQSNSNETVLTSDL